MYMDDIGGVDNEFDKYNNKQLVEKRAELDFNLLEINRLDKGTHPEVPVRLEKIKSDSRKLNYVIDKRRSGNEAVPGLFDANVLTLVGLKDKIRRSSMVQDIPNGIANQVAEKTAEDMLNQFNKTFEEIKGMIISDQEIREFAGIFDASGSPSVRIESLDANGDHYRLLALNESDPRKKQFYESMSKASYLKADYMRVTETGELPKHNEGVRTLDDNIRSNESIGDLSRLERFKKWIKENWLGASALGVTVAAFITTIVIAARSAIFKGGGALGRMGNSTANSADKAGPLLKELLNIMATALKWGAAGVSWLSNNLWVLVLAFLWYVYGSRK